MSIPWGVEVTLEQLTPKNISKECIVKKIVVGAIYVKPNSGKKEHMITLLMCKTASMQNMAEEHIGYWQVTQTL